VTLNPPKDPGMMRNQNRKCVTKSETRHRRNAPWYTTKTGPSTMDMLYALRDTLTIHRINPTTPGHATPKQNANQQVSPQRVAS
jgi:hypothetical protein